MTNSITIAPPHSLILITGGGELVEATCDLRPGQGVISTPTCIGVICFPFQDGPTTIALGPSTDMTGNPEFSGYLETPSRMVTVSTAVKWQKILEARVPTSRTKIKIWRNHPQWPTEVFIGIGD